jgi:hypothetical protein
MRTTLLTCLLAACSNPSPSHTDAPVKNDAADAPASVDAPAQPDAPTVATGGLVTLGLFHAGSVTTGDATAQFVAGSIYGETLGASGGCTLYNNPPTSGLSAGEITVTGTTTSVTLSPSGTPVKYATSTLPMPLFAAGATLTVTAAGANFPAFTTTVTAPSPLAGFSTPSSISRGAGYTAAWTAGTAHVWVLISAEIGAGNADLLLCKVADTGSFTVTPAALALFPQSVTSVAVSLARVGETDLTVGSGEVDVVALDLPLGSGSTTLAP